LQCRHGRHDYGQVIEWLAGTHTDIDDVATARQQACYTAVLTISPEVRDAPNDNRTRADICAEGLRETR